VCREWLKSMTNKIPISVFVIAFNEADRIVDTIASVRDWVDEIIVIDSGSSDATVKVSEENGARIMYNQWPGYGLQKRFGEDQCRNDWILNLDADEVVSPALKAEIQAISNTNNDLIPAWKIRIVEILPGRAKPVLFAHQVNAIRLYNRKFGRYSDSTVHDTVRMNSGEVRQMLSIIEHRSSRGIAHTLDKINRYSTMQAENLINGKGISFPILRLVTEFPLSFLKAYFLRCYFVAGLQGFSSAMVYAFSRFVRIAKYLELTGKK